MISGNTVFGRSDKEGHGRGEQLLVLSGSENMQNTFCREQEIGDNWKRNIQLIKTDQNMLQNERTVNI